MTQVFRFNLVSQRSLNIRFLWPDIIRTGNPGTHTHTHIHTHTQNRQ